MFRSTALIGATFLTSLAISLPISDATAQTAKEVVGSWTMASNVNARPDGSKTETFGPNPRGSLIFTSDGRFSIVNSRSDLPNFTSNNRITGTPEENKAVIAGSIALVGTYSVDAAGKTITLNVENSTFPNWNGTPQQRPFTLAGDEMKWVNPTASAGGTAEIVWKRIPPSTTGSATR